MIAVTFDYGYTLAKIDFEFMAKRLAERGFLIDPVRAEAGMPLAWKAYEIAKAAGHENAWLEMMKSFLVEGGIANEPDVNGQAPAEAMALWLWHEQPHKNLWRKPIAGMFELVEELIRKRVPVGIISNSEGRLAELVAELGKEQLFQVIADSGRLGFDKPDARIFEYTADKLHVTTQQVIHVGDSWEADIVGALGVGARAVWFSTLAPRILPEGVAHCRTADELRAVLSDWGALPA